MAAQICETCKNKGCRCYCPPNSTCGAYEPSEPKVITWFEKIRSMDIDDFAEWLDKHGRFGGSLHMQWWEKNYCSQCPLENGYLHDCTGEYDYYVPTEFAWCEKHNKCRFFPDMDEAPDNKEIIKMWLESEVK